MKRFLLTLCLCLPLSLLAQQKNLMSSEGFKFNIDAAGKAHITGHSKSQSELTGMLVVPETVANTATGISYPVVSITGFEDYTLLTGLSLPNSLTTIGPEAFYRCSGFTGELKIPNSVTTIGNNAFDYCPRLTSFTVEAGSALTSLGTHIWQSCFGLRYIDLTHIPATALTSGYGGGAGAYFSRSDTHLPFSNLLSHTVVYLPTGVDGSRITQNDSTANYVLDGQCQWLSVQDSYDYELPHPFTALNATYNANSTTNYRTFSGTTCKPASPGGASPTKNFAIFLSEGEDTETGLAETHAALRRGQAPIHDLQGRYMGTDFEALPQGLYIVDGKKVYKM